jgi:hypothetical protein
VFGTCGRAFETDGQSSQTCRRQSKSLIGMVLGGGYSKSERKLRQSTRQALIARAKGKCQKCGKRGAEIDHIAHSSDDLSNLQLLCAVCHREKTFASAAEISPKSHPEAWAHRRKLLRRIEARVPLRLCDAEDWKDLSRMILTARRRMHPGWIRTAR